MNLKPIFDFIPLNVLFSSIITLCSLTSNTNAQSDTLYKIKGIVVLSGLHLKPVSLSLMDKNGVVIRTVASYGIGQFAISGLRNGRYHFVNHQYKIDTAFAIQGKDIDNFLVELNVCDMNAEQAQIDIKQQSPKLLLSSGIVPVHYYGQEGFEKKYHVEYYDYGCQAINEKCMVEYNRTIFKYLDKKYGNSWRGNVRKDVLGYQ